MPKKENVTNLRNVRIQPQCCGAERIPVPVKDNTNNKGFAILKG